MMGRTCGIAVHTYTYANIHANLYAYSAKIVENESEALAQGD